MHPGQRVVAKDLACRCDRFRFIQRTDVEHNAARRDARLLRDRRAALRAEMPEDRLAAATQTGERFRCAVYRHRLRGKDGEDTECAAGELLAVAAMTHGRHQRFGRCRVAHRAAETAACQLRQVVSSIGNISRASRCSARGILNIRLEDIERDQRGKADPRCARERWGTSDSRPRPKFKLGHDPSVAVIPATALRNR
jgi:hypothetical protein